MVTRSAFTAAQVALFYNKVFPQIMAAHLDAVWGALRRWGAEVADADDLSQEVFASLLQRAPAEGMPVSLRAKLLADALGKLRNQRREGKREAAGLPSSGSELPTSVPDLARRLDHLEFRRQILAALTAEQLAAVDAVFMRGLSEAQAAAELGVPRTTLHAQIRAAMPAMSTVAEALFSESERR